MKNIIITLLLECFTHKIRFLEKLDKDNNPVVGVSVYAPELHKGTTDGYEMH
jgi:hypothetical protein